MNETLNIMLSSIHNYFNTSTVNYENVTINNLTTTNTDVISSTTTSMQMIIKKPACRKLIDAEFGSTRVRVLDLIILIPNLFFLFFLTIKLKTAIVKLQRNSSAIFGTFYVMVFVVAIMGVLRSIVSMTVNASMPAGDIADKVLWLILRFFLLAVEMSVLIFGIAFGHLESRKSIQRVLIVTGLISLIYSITQGTLEFIKHDENFNILSQDNNTYNIFGHGGMPFYFFSSFLFFTIYSIIVILKFSNINQRFQLPPKKSFYYYCGTLSFINFLQVIGSSLLFFHNINGMCLINASTLVYFTSFAPMVYFTFMKDFFKNTSSLRNLMFSYQANEDEDHDDVHLDSQSMNKEDHIEKIEHSTNVDNSLSSKQI